MVKRWLSIGVGGAAIALITLAAGHTDAVLYNHSPSIPVGFYLRDERAIERGAVVTVRAVDVAPETARARGFDSEGDQFIKRVAAVAGQHVCSDADVLTIDGRVAAERYAQASSELRMWSGCRVLRNGEVLLLGDSADSFDGRYWGPVSVDLITGVWRPL